MRTLSLFGLSAAALLLVACDRYPHPWDDYHEQRLAPDVAPSPVDQPAPIAVAKPRPPLVGGVELFEPSGRSRFGNEPAASMAYPGARGAVCSCAPSPSAESAGPSANAEPQEEATKPKAGAKKPAPKKKPGRAPSR
jgi:hypothetical protein